MFAAVISFFEEGRMCRELNYTDVVLILKQSGSELVTHFKPISLCNFIYKMISRVMVNRLSPFFGGMIIDN